jgi:hypothetical protein
VTDERRSQSLTDNFECGQDVIDVTPISYPVDPRHLVDPLGREIFRVASPSSASREFGPGRRWYRINDAEVSEEEFNRRLAESGLMP